MDYQTIQFLFIFGCLSQFISTVASSNSSSLDLEGDSILNWKPDVKLQRAYPYYLSGYDKDGRPIWVTEFGKWDVKKAVEADEKAVQDFYKYGDQVFARFKESTKSNDTMEYYKNQIIAIADYEGFSLTQFASVPVIQFVVRILTKHSASIFAMVHRAYVINANILAETLTGVLKPILGDRVQVYGTNAARWKPILVKNLPRDQFPEWYGGTLDAQHLVKVYG